MKEDEEIYVLTLKGMIGAKIYERIKEYAEKINKNGILLNEGGSFIEIEND